jgi:hypothetical protein
LGGFGATVVGFLTCGLNIGMAGMAGGLGGSLKLTSGSGSIVSILKQGKSA